MAHSLTWGFTTGLLQWDHACLMTCTLALCMYVCMLCQLPLSTTAKLRVRPRVMSSTAHTRAQLLPLPCLHPAIAALVAPAQDTQHAQQKPPLQVGSELHTNNITRACLTGGFKPGTLLVPVWHAACTAWQPAGRSRHQLHSQGPSEQHLHLHTLLHCCVCPASSSGCPLPTLTAPLFLLE